MLVLSLLILSTNSIAQVKITVQGKTVFGFLGNYPSQGVGVSIYRLEPIGYSIYFDAKTSLFHGYDKNDKYYSNMSKNMAENYFGHKMIDKKKDYHTINAGVTRILNNGLVIWGGLGVTIVKKWRKYLDIRTVVDSQKLGYRSEYWIKDGKSYRPNITGGVGFKYGRHGMIQLGASTTPPGITGGIGLMF